MPQSIRRDATADPYAWLEQRDAPEVRDFLDAENQATEAWLASHDDRREALFEEIRGRIRETDLSLPGVWGPWLYYQRTEAGDEYPRYYRCARVAPDSLEIDKPTEQLLLDLNLLAGVGPGQSAPVCHQHGRNLTASPPVAPETGCRAGAPVP